MLRILLGFCVIFILTACPENDTGVEGRLLFDGQPLVGAQLEVYLRGGQDRSTAPFAVTTTDAEGRYQVDLPQGRYFLIGKKRETAEGGHDRMLKGECPGNPVEIESGRLQVAAFSLAEMGRGRTLVPDPGTGVTGRVVSEGQPVAGAHVYIYTDDSSSLMGPSYSEAVQTDSEGRYQVALPAGRFFFAARKRFDGGRLGEPAPGDLNGVHSSNPVVLERGLMMALPDLGVSPVDQAIRRERRGQGKFIPTDTVVTGRVVDKEGSPQRGIYLFAYDDSRMVGKPGCISEATAEDGRFALYLGEGGTWYVGARSTFGGPLEPGERIGTYDGRADHGILLQKGTRTDIGELRVREVW